MRMRTARDRTRERELRQSMTDTEQKLWYLLRDRRLSGFKFRRQHRIGPYYADFVCLGSRLIVEADGGQHLERMQYDAARTHYLESRGFRVLRFWNHEVLKEAEAVLEAVLGALEGRDGWSG